MQMQSDMPDQIPSEYAPLPLPVPPMLEEVLGYRRWEWLRHTSGSR
ncbi:MAG TPA: hypothetical protein VH186_25270 [Chloroflexia bacterium]|nr:hypothetical protein [Chloroflexia bacterium]